jgi:hypothetical protein
LASTSGRIESPFTGKKIGEELVWSRDWNHEFILGSDEFEIPS